MISKPISTGNKISRANLNLAGEGDSYWGRRRGDRKRLCLSLLSLNNIVAKCLWFNHKKLVKLKNKTYVNYAKDCKDAKCHRFNSIKFQLLRDTLQVNLN